MKQVVINPVWGSFHCPEEVQVKTGMYTYTDKLEDRQNPELIAWVQQHQDETDLIVINLPDTASNICIHEDDGMEELSAVINGKTWWFNDDDYEDRI